MANPDVKGTQIDPEELNAAFLAVRAHADKSMYGKYISDDECKSVAADVVAAVEGYRGGTSI
jgi:hypothetical protein